MKERALLKYKSFSVKRFKEFLPKEVPTAGFQILNPMKAKTCLEMRVSLY
jgi:hypothetical protein